MRRTSVERGAVPLTPDNDDPPSPADGTEQFLRPAVAVGPTVPSSPRPEAASIAPAAVKPPSDYRQPSRSVKPFPPAPMRADSALLYFDPRARIANGKEWAPQIPPQPTRLPAYRKPPQPPAHHGWGPRAQGPALPPAQHPTLRYHRGYSGSKLTPIPRPDPFARRASSTRASSPLRSASAEPLGSMRAASAASLERSALQRPPSEQHTSSAMDGRCSSQHGISAEEPYIQFLMTKASNRDGVFGHVPSDSRSSSAMPASRARSALAPTKSAANPMDRWLAAFHDEERKLVRDTHSPLPSHLVEDMERHRRFLRALHAGDLLEEERTQPIGHKVQDDDGSAQELVRLFEGLG